MVEPLYQCFSLADRQVLGDDFARRRRPVSGAAFDDALQQLLSQLQSTADERLVALRFTFQQLQSHLDDLRQRAEEFAAIKASRR